MYACIHANKIEAEALLALGCDFSPIVEQTSANTVVFSIDPLRTLLGSPHQIASEICRRGHERKLEANLAIAANVDTAVLLARCYAGVTVIAAGEERRKLAPLPLHSLFVHEASLDPALLDILHRWGLKTCEDMAALPERGVAERLGQAGVYLHRLASGAVDRPLRVAPTATNYEERVELEHALHLLEPLLFLLSRTLGELCSRLRTQSQAARLLEARFDLEQHTCNRAQLLPDRLCANPYRCELEFPTPLDQAQTILKLLQLHLERHPPEAAVTAFTLRVAPAEPRRVQGGMFLPPTPPPDKLQVTLARIAAMVGQDNVGTPRLLDTHRPDAFEWSTLNMSSPDMPGEAPMEQRQTVRLAIRLFRPALEARIRFAGAAPKTVAATGVKGTVLRCAGPWKTSGEWWAQTAWMREEWDVALNDGAVYRIYCELPARAWYVQGVYD
jgi:protein ImuB